MREGRKIRKSLSGTRPPHTGTKFLIFAQPHQPNIDVIVKRVYELYADYVMKNPFYQIEMPIRCEAFDRNLLAYIQPRQ